MKKHDTKEKLERNLKVAKLYYKGSYTLRGLARVFRLSHPRILAIAKKYRRRLK